MDNLADRQLASEPWVDGKAVMAHFSLSKTALWKLTVSGRVPSKGFSNGARIYRRYRISEIEAAMTLPERATRL